MSTLKQWIRADCTLVQNWFWDYRVHSWSANEFIVRNQLMFTQRTAVIQQGPATTQLMFNHTQRSARQHLKQASSSLNCLSTSFQPPLGPWLLFWHTVKKYPSHYMIYQKNTGYAATLRHSIGSSSPQYSPSCLEARYFYLWRVHSIGHFHNSSRCCLKWKTNYTFLMLLSQHAFPVIQTPSQSLDRLRCQPNTGQEQCSSSSNQVWLSLS